MLRPDTLYRGKNAVHVYKHHKLGQHRTIIKTALPFINAALGLKEVWRIDFGKISRTTAGKRPGITVKVDQAKVHVTITGACRWQEFLICARAVSYTATVVAALHAAEESNGHSS